MRAEMPAAKRPVGLKELVHPTLRPGPGAGLTCAASFRLRETIYPDRRLSSTAKPHDGCRLLFPTPDRLSLTAADAP